MAARTLRAAAAALAVALASARLGAGAVPPQGYVLVPGGYMHRSCVHAALGSPLEQARLAPCAHPFLRSRPGAGVNATHGSAWKAWAQFAQGGTASVSSLVSTWAVPGDPTGNENGVTLFWWNGIEPSDTSAVLQPVIQYGSSAAGGGAYWAYSSWYVSSSHGSQFSPLVRIEVGDVVTGSNVVDAATGTWNITSAAPGRKSTTLSFKPVPGSWATAYHVLEAYGITNNCQDYPAVGSVNFTSISLAFNGKRPVSPIAWVPMTQTAGCNEHATASAAGDEVSILF